MIDLAKPVKIFVSQLLLGSTDPAVFQKTRETKHAEEKKMLHEVFAALGTSLPVLGRKFDRMFVCQAVDKCPCRKKLKGPTIESSITGLQKHRAYSFLGSIS